MNLSLPRSVCNYLSVGGEFIIIEPSPIGRRDIEIQIDIPAKLVELAFVPVQQSSFELIFSLQLLSDFTDFGVGVLQKPIELFTTLFRNNAVPGDTAVKVTPFAAKVAFFLR